MNSVYILYCTSNLKKYNQFSKTYKYTSTITHSILQVWQHLAKT